MKFTMKIVLAVSLAIAAPVLASPLDLEARASDKCKTVKTGYFSIFHFDGTWTAVGVNSKNQVTYGAGDPKLQVEFQSCPKTGLQYPKLNDYTGQIVVKGTSNCVTVSNPTNGNGPFFLEVSKCKSTTYPPDAQYWEYGNDFGAVVFWEGTSREDEIGWTSVTNDPVTDSSHRIELGCAISCSSFGIVKHAS